jgi:hypothetical protein
MYFEKNKGKIIIKVDNVEGKMNSVMEFRGIAKNTETALTTLLVNFVSLSLEKGKDPQKVLEKHFDGILKMLKSGKKIDNT